jgi:type III secretion protein V
VGAPLRRAAAAASGPDDPFAPAVPVALELAPGLHALAVGGELTGRGLASLRADLWHFLGVNLPALAVRRSGDLACSGFRLRIGEIPVHQGRAPLDELLMLASPDDLALVGIAARRTTDPVSRRPVALVAEAHRTRAAALGRVCEPLERVLVEVAGALRRNAHHLLGVQEVQCLLDDLEPQAPALVREVSRQVPVTLLAEVLRRLVEEGLSIRPFWAILKAVLRAGAGTQPAAPLAEPAGARSAGSSGTQTTVLSRCSCSIQLPSKRSGTTGPERCWP